MISRRDPRDEDQAARVLVVKAWPDSRYVDNARHADKALDDVARSVGFRRTQDYMSWLAGNDVTRDEFLARLREHWEECPK